MWKVRVRMRRPGFPVVALASPFDIYIRTGSLPPNSEGSNCPTDRQCLNPCGDLPVLQACELYVSGIGASEPLRPETASGL